MTNARPEQRPRSSPRSSNERPFARIATIRGVPVVVTPSWMLTAVLLAAVYGPVVRDMVDGISASTAYLAALGFTMVFGGCVLAHELGHTVVSLKLGHPVRRVVLFAFGGVSEIDGEPGRARDEFLVAAAGPLVSVLLATPAWWGATAVSTGTLPGVLLASLAASNVLLAAFNLLPGLPLDGGRLLRALAWACGASLLTSTRIALDRRPWTPVSTVARPLEPRLLVPAGLDASALLERMRATPAREYLVVDPAGAAAGIISSRDFVERLRGATSRATSAA